MTSLSRFLFLLLAALLGLLLQLGNHLGLHNLLLLQKVFPLFIQLFFLRLGVEFYRFLSQFLRLLVQQDDSRYIFFPPHSLPLNKLFISLVVVHLFVLDQLVLNVLHIVVEHAWIVHSAQVIFDIQQDESLIGLEDVS